jgi:hypothetical protein
MLLLWLLLTSAEQRDNEGLSDALKRDITQGLLERYGVDNGVAIADSCCFFDFETCETVNLHESNVRLLSFDYMCNAR